MATKKKRNLIYSDAIEDTAPAAKEPTALEAAQNRVDSMSYANSPYQQQISDLLDGIMNRQKFQYDMNADPIYQQYKDQYISGGRNAMMDTMGQASALTGGFGNSYASTAGSQAYQSYLGGLNDKAGELYDRAYQTYQNEGNQMVQNLGLLQDQENANYARYRDAYNDALNERNFAYQQQQDQQQQNNWNAEFNYNTRKAKKWRKNNPQYFGNT